MRNFAEGAMMWPSTSWGYRFVIIVVVVFYCNCRRHLLLGLSLSLLKCSKSSSSLLSRDAIFLVLIIMFVVHCTGAAWNVFRGRSNAVSVDFVRLLCSHLLWLGNKVRRSRRHRYRLREGRCCYYCRPICR